MTLEPRSRVTVTPYAGPERRGVVVSKVSDVSAYVVRYPNGDRHTVPAVQLKELSSDTHAKPLDTQANHV